MVAERLQIEAARDDRAEEQVLGQGGVVVVALRIVRLDQVAQVFRVEARAELAPGFERAFRQPGRRFRTDGATQAEAVDVARHLDMLQHLDQPAVGLIRAVDAERRVVDPVVVEVLGRIAGPHVLGQPLFPRLPGRVVKLRLAQGPVLQAEDEIGAHAVREQVGRRSDVGHAPAEIGFRPGLDVVARDGDASAGRREQAHEQHGELVLAAAGRADQRPASPRRGT